MTSTVASSGASSVPLAGAVAPVKNTPPSVWDKLGKDGGVFVENSPLGERPGYVVPEPGSPRYFTPSRVKPVNIRQFRSNEENKDLTAAGKVAIVVISIKVALLVAVPLGITCLGLAAIGVGAAVALVVGGLGYLIASGKLSNCSDCCSDCAECCSECSDCCSDYDSNNGLDFFDRSARNDLEYFQPREEMQPHSPHASSGYRSAYNDSEDKFKKDFDEAVRQSNGKDVKESEAAADRDDKPKKASPFASINLFGSASSAPTRSRYDSSNESVVATETRYKVVPKSKEVLAAEERQRLQFVESVRAHAARHGQVQEIAPKELDEKERYEFELRKEKQRKLELDKQQVAKQKESGALTASTRANTNSPRSSSQIFSFVHARNVNPYKSVAAAAVAAVAPLSTPTAPTNASSAAAASVSNL